MKTHETFSSFGGRTGHRLVQGLRRQHLVGTAGEV